MGGKHRRHMPARREPDDRDLLRVDVHLVGVVADPLEGGDAVARAITENLDLTRHMEDAVQSLAICLAADESVRSGQPVKL